LENRGNIDMDLLMVEMWAPADAVDGNSYRPNYGGLLDWRVEQIDGRQYQACRYTTVIGPGTLGIESLRSVLTPSMGKLVLNPIGIALARGLELQTYPFPLFYQVHARSYDTVKEKILFGDIPVEN
jgi:hypothetical protein